MDCNPMTALLARRLVTKKLIEDRPWIQTEVCIYGLQSYDFPSSWYDWS
jgi:hypothetical protein